MDIINGMYQYMMCTCKNNKDVRPLTECSSIVTRTDTIVTPQTDLLVTPRTIPPVTPQTIPLSSSRVTELRDHINNKIISCNSICSTSNQTLLSRNKKRFFWSNTARRFWWALFGEPATPKIRDSRYKNIMTFNSTSPQIPTRQKVIRVVQFYKNIKARRSLRSKRRVPIDVLRRVKKVAKEAREIMKDSGL